MARIYYDNRGTENLQAGVGFGLRAFDQVNGALQQNRSMEIQRSLAEERMSQDREQTQALLAQRKAEHEAASTYNTAKLTQDSHQADATLEQKYILDAAKRHAAAQQRQGVVDAVTNAKGGTLDPATEARLTGKVPESMLNKPASANHEDSIFYREQENVMSKAKARVENAKNALELVTKTDKFEGTKTAIPGQEKAYNDAKLRYEQATEYLDAVTNIPSHPTKTVATEVTPPVSAAGPAAAAPGGDEQWIRAALATPPSPAGSKGPINKEQLADVLHRTGKNKELTRSIVARLGYIIPEAQPESRLNVTPPGTKPTAQPANPNTPNAPQSGESFFETFGKMYSAGGMHP